MTSIANSGLGHGSLGAPQQSLDESNYTNKETQNEGESSNMTPPKYVPSPKHESGHNWGSENPIKSISEGQSLLDTGYHDGRQVYNVTNEGVIVKFQPDGTPENGYHAYEVSKPRDIPISILKEMYNDGKISKTDYKKYMKGKK